MQEEIKGFMLVPVTIDINGAMVRGEPTAVYPLPIDMSSTIASLKHGEEQWKVSIIMEKILPEGTVLPGQEGV